MSVLVIVAGPNGSGKTTLVRRGALSSILPASTTMLNADDVARELARGGQPDDVQSLQAARITDARLDTLIAAGESVVIETVLSSDKYQARVEAAKQSGYLVDLVYITVRNPETSEARVAHRVAGGGHGVPLDRIRARRGRSHRMFAWFARQADRVFVFDNTDDLPRLVATKGNEGWTLRIPATFPADLAMVIQALAANP